MKSIDNKKAQNLDGTGLIAVNKGILTMSNITHIADGKQVRISEEQAVRIAAFFKNSTDLSVKLNSLCKSIEANTPENSDARVLVNIARNLVMEFWDECIEEKQWVSENSSKLDEVLKEYAA